MPTPGRRALSTALALAAVGLAACGSEDGTIPPQDAEALLAQLEKVEAAVEDRNCTTAQTEVSQLTAQVNALPKEVGVETKESLRRLSENLSGLVSDPEQCDQPAGATGETGEILEEPPATEEPAPPVEEEPAPPAPEEDDEPPAQPDDEGTGLPPEDGSGTGPGDNSGEGGGVGEEG